jgi:hypothetical protein
MTTSKQNVKPSITAKTRIISTAQVTPNAKKTYSARIPSATAKSYAKPKTQAERSNIARLAALKAHHDKQTGMRAENGAWQFMHAMTVRAENKSDKAIVAAQDAILKALPKTAASLAAKYFPEQAAKYFPNVRAAA